MTRQVALPIQIQVLERGWLSANNILFLGRDESALIDSGYATHSEQTLALIGAALGNRSLDLLLNTHLHSDHCGGNAALQQRYPAVRTHIPKGEAALVQRWDVSALSFQATAQHCPRFRFDHQLEAGQDILLGDLLWNVHAAPGHDPHSIVLFEPKTRILISADALWERGFGIVFPELVGEPSFDEVAATLDLIETLDPAYVIPGHGGPFSNVADALSVARSKLDAFARSPAKHARHALKVLVKFKLLEAQTLSIEEWRRWVANTPYVEKIRARYFCSSTLDELSGQILDELVRTGAAQANAVHVSNR